MINEPIKTIETENFVAKIYYDDSAENPAKDWDTLGELVHLDRCYFREQMPENMTNRQFFEEYGHCIMVPISTSHTARDGRYYWKIDKGDYMEEYKNTAYTKAEKKEHAIQFAENFARTMTQYFEGEVYGFVIENIHTGEEVDSCWSYFGMDHVKEEVNNLLKHLEAKELEAEQFEKVSFAL